MLLTCQASGRQKAEIAIAIRHFFLHDRDKEEDIRKWDVPQFLSRGRPRHVESIQDKVEKNFE